MASDDDDNDNDNDDDDAIPRETVGPISICTSLEIFDSHLVRELNRKPSDLHRLSARQFELLVAEILRDMGAEVEVTPASRDGGVDVLAVFPTPLGKMLTLVECKKYSPAHPVGVGYVERFVCLLRERTKANVGLIATTSRFTAGGKAWQRELPWQLRLAEFDHILEWLSQYGKWSKQGGSRIWLPKTHA